MNKFWKQTMALFLAFALVFGTLVPVVAWAEEPANVGEPSVEASEPEAPLEEETQTEPEESRSEAETEGKETEENEELEFSKENTPDAQGEPAGTAKTFTITKRAYDNENDPEKLVGNYDTFYDAIDACKQQELENLYIVTMNSDYTIPGEEGLWGKSSVNILLQSARGHQYKLTRQLKDEPRRNFLDLGKDCHLTVKNVILDGGNDTQFAFLAKNAQLTLAKGTVIQNCVDNPDLDGPAIFLRGNSTLNIEDGVVIKDNTSDLADDYCAGVIYATDNSIVNIKGGEFTNNHSNKKDGGVIRSGSDAVVNIYDGTFKENSAKKLGGVIQAYGEVNITGGTFEGNEASTGGAVYAKKASIQNAEFLSNKATWGGAVFIAGEATIQKSVFKENKTSSAGGALYTSGVTLVENSEFQSNKSIQGGAVYTKANITLKKSTLHSNTAEKHGGAIFSNGELDVSGTSFTQNEAKVGGAVLAIAKMTSTGDTFTSNKAKEFGGAVVIADVAEITKSKFESNEAQNGGAIYTQGMTTINGTGFASNKAEVHGGALYVDALLTDRQGNVTKVNTALKVKIGENTKFESNKAGKEGGAIYTMPHQYKNPIVKDHTGDPIAEQHPYENLEIDNTTLFQGNKADGGLFDPPENYEEFTNLQFDPQSDVKHGKLTRESLLNNYDVNYDNNMRTITYDANGGRFADGKRIKTSKYPVDANIKIMEAPTRRGYTFQYWKGSKYQPGDPYTVKDNHTFVAQWEKDKRPPRPNITEEIIVDPNGGTFFDGTTGRKTYDLKAGETFLLPAAPTREGYKFVAWQGKDAEYQPGYPYIVQSGGEVFTARWEEEKKPEEKPSVTPNIKTPKGTPLTPDEIAKILAGMKKTVPAIPRAGVGK